MGMPASPKAISPARIKKWLSKIDKALRSLELVDTDQMPLQKLRIDVQWVGAVKMRTLNKKFLKKDFVTDVLSFPAPKKFTDSGYMGELVICDSQTQKQAKEQGHSMSQETDVLLVHGLLHLMGLDHERDDEQAQLMHTIEEWVLGSTVRSGPKGLTGREAGRVAGRAHKAKRAQAKS